MRPSRTKLAAHYLPVLLGCAAIFVVSSMPRPPVPEVLSFWNSDKLLHAAAYCVLASLALIGARARAGGLTQGARLEAALVAASYGALDELHQGFVPGRSMSGFDLIADAVGAALGAFFVGVALIRARERYRRRPAG